MMLFRALSTVVLGLSALALGCADEGDDLDESDAPEADAPLYATQGGVPGMGGMNNLPPLDFHGHKEDLFGATQAALATYVASDKTWWLANNASNNALLASTGGRNVLKYAIRCTLLSSSTVNAQLGASVVSYPGQGLLTTATAWKTAPLDADATDDLFTCLLAHLNANGVAVPINLSGPNVRNTFGSDTSFDWEEALWAAKLVHDDDGGTAYHFYVWPRAVAGCSNVAVELANRVCGSLGGACGLTMRTDLDSACTETAAGWYCNDATGHALPAILTKLKLGDVKKLYSGCI